MVRSRQRSRRSFGVCLVNACAFGMRPLLASVLVLAVAASAVPPGAVSAAHGCSMPCCTGADGSAGDGEGESCHVSLRQKAKPAKPADDDPMCGADEASPSPARAAGAHHATTGHVSTHVQDSDEVEHSSHHQASPRDASTESVRASPILSKACPPDCGAILNALTQLRRPRDEAALTHKLRPRPPSAKVRPPDRAGVAKTSFALRRRYPPRAPPPVSTSQPA